MYTVEEEKHNKIADTIRHILSADCFPLFTAAVLLVLYYAGQDIAAICFYALEAILMLVFLDDLTPIIPHSLFMSVLISYKNSPNTLIHDNNGGYYFEPLNLGIIIAVITIAALAVLYRAVVTRKRLKFNAMCLGLAAFSAALLLNGVGTKDYTPMNLFYGFSLSFLFAVPYAVFSGNVTQTKENFIKVGHGVMAFSLLLLTELAIKYATDWDYIVVGGAIEKGALLFGWGIWNTMGMMLVVCIPFAFLLASNFKYGFIYVIYATVLSAAAFLTGSRQSMLGTVVVYPISAIICIVCSKDKWSRFRNGITFGAMIAFVIIFTASVWKDLMYVFSGIFENLFDESGYTGNGRISLIKQALSFFVGAPVTGQGFYLSFGADPGFVGLDGVIPLMAHNTFAELLATCGILGLICYLFHRVITVICFIHKATPDRAFVAMSILGLLLLCMFDNHIFYLFPTFFYSCLMCFATSADVPAKPKLKKIA